MKTIINFRDFGNYPTLHGRRIKKGWLYRSGQLDHASSQDLATLSALGIKTVIDLRSKRERKRNVHLWPGARIISLPMAFDELTQKRLMPLLFKHHVENTIVDMIAGVYRDTVDHAGPQLVAIFRLLSKPNTFPVLIHCRAGRDRTGFVSAVIQLALGVSETHVIEDYLRSDAFLLPFAPRMITMLNVFSLGLFPTRNLRTAFTSQEHYIRSVIDRIENKYQGIEEYLKWCGVKQQEFEALIQLNLR